MRIIKLSIMLLLCFFSTFTLAAYHKNQMHPKPPMTGWYFGLGAGYSSLMVNYSDVSYGDYKPIAYQATVNNLFPAVQMGYWGGFRDRPAMWGLKAFYKYLSASTNYLLSNGFGIYDNHDTDVTHEVALLLTFGFCMRRMTPYLGLGAMWLPTVRDKTHTNGPFISDQNIRKSLFGAIIQLGFLYNITPKWFVDTVYSYGFTGKSRYEGVLNPNLDTKFSRKVRVSAQEVMMSVNRRF